MRTPPRRALGRDPRGRERLLLGRRLAAARSGARRRAAGRRCTTRSPPSRARSTRATRAAIRARAYDLVWNGSEIGGGSIRISDTAEQERVLGLLGIDAEEAEARFGFLLEALRFGAPPHGGIAYGIDRICALAAGTDSIRDVIAFPKTASGGDPLTGAPAPVDERQLRELGVTVRRSPAPQ